MIRRFLFMFVACLALVAASCSTGGGNDDADGDGEATTTEPNDGDDETTTTEPGDGETTTTTEGSNGGGGGGTGGGGSRQAYVDAMVESLLSDDDSFPVTEAQARCVGESWVNIFDPERLAAAGISPEDIASDSDDDNDLADLGLSESEAGGLVDTFGDCGIDLTKAMVDSIGEDQTLTAEDRACLEGAFNEDFLRRLFVITLTQGDDAVEEDPQLMGEMMGALFACPGAMGLSEGDL